MLKGAFQSMMKRNVKAAITGSVLTMALTFGLLPSFARAEVADVIALTDSTDKVYAVTNPNMGETLYTTDEKEKDFLVKVGYTDDGIAFVTATESKYPVYRVYNPNSGMHLYTVNEGERDFLVSIGYNSEGVAFYSSGTVRVYRCYDNTTGLHRYTLKSNDKNVEGIGFNVVEADKDVINAYYNKIERKSTRAKITETGCDLYRAEEGYMFSWGAKVVNSSYIAVRDVVVKAEIYDDAGNIVDTREALVGNLMPGASAFAGSTLPINVKGKLITRAMITIASEEVGKPMPVETKVTVRDVSSDVTYSEKYSYPSAEKVSLTYKNESKDSVTGFMNIVYRNEDNELLGVAKTDVKLSGVKKGVSSSVKTDMEHPGPTEQRKVSACFIDSSNSKISIRETATN